MSRLLRFCCFVLLARAPAASAADVDYSREVRPIFAEKCGSCHGVLKQEAGLRLDAGKLARQGGDSGPALAATPEESLIWQRVSATDPAERMPPEGTGTPLTAEQLDVVRRWLAAGAPSPDDEEVAESPRDHWAYQLPQRADVPTIDDAHWSANPIDAFLAESHHAAGVTPLGPADAATLLRRVTLDLTGLPPTRDELHAFLADSSPTAYEAVVDRLLASPRYSERWARHWMDVWRYSDWDGYGKELRGSQRHMWRWRDWIVESLDADKPYDQMIAEMLAGDELAPEDPNVLRATGFLARQHYSLNRDLWLDNAVEHTFKAFQGVTINCNKCHDHKYDPLPQADYYSIRAIFEPYKVRIDRIAGVADTTQDGVTRAFDAEPETPTFLFKMGNEKHPDKEHPMVPAVPGVLGGHYSPNPVALPLTAWFPDLRPHVIDEVLTASQSSVDAAQAESVAAEAALSSVNEAERPAAAARSKLAGQKRNAAIAAHSALTARLAADLAKAAQPAAAESNAMATTAAGAERLSTLRAAEVAVTTAEQALTAAQAAVKEEDAKTKEAVAAAEKKLAEARTKLDEATQALAKTDAAYTAFGPQYPRKSTGRRLALARWIASRDNPLTARVAVNHIWLRHFGSAIVPETFDFGLRSPRPKLQPVLDWLAVEFMDQGWRTKPIHRLIVTSQAYRLASSGDPAVVAANVTVDPENLRYWRANTLRLDAEVVRDSILSVAGVLDTSRSGADIDYVEGEQVLRRSLYFRHAYEKQMRMLTLFDAASPNECYRRTTSIVPQQALALANSTLVVAQSRKLAGKLSADSNVTDDAAFVTAGFETVLTRRPTAEELAACVEYLSSQRELLTSAGTLTAFDAGPKIETPASADPALRARENLIQVLINHTDFVTRR
jgi:mono/diheme cytochrome c family protein